MRSSAVNGRGCRPIVSVAGTAPSVGTGSSAIRPPPISGIAPAAPVVGLGEAPMSMPGMLGSRRLRRGRQDTSDRARASQPCGFWLSG